TPPSTPLPYTTLFRSASVYSAAKAPFKDDDRRLRPKADGLVDMHHRPIHRVIAGLNLRIPAFARKTNGSKLQSLSNTAPAKLRRSEEHTSELQSLRHL